MHPLKLKVHVSAHYDESINLDLSKLLLCWALKYRMFLSSIIPQIRSVGMCCIQHICLNSLLNATASDFGSFTLAKRSAILYLIHHSYIHAHGPLLSPLWSVNIFPFTPNLALFHSSPAFIHFEFITMRITMRCKLLVLSSSVAS